VTVFLHCDVDKMFYAVEALERPDLASDTRAVIIGSDPRVAPRGIVTTANAVARSVGISSGLSTAIALRMAIQHGLETVFIPPRHHLYAQYSRRLMDLLGTESLALEQRSIDEAALDWTQHGFAVEPVSRLRQRILDEIGLSVSFGLAANLLVAKMASEVAKAEPSHVYAVQPGDEAAFLAPLPIRALVGVGPKSEARLRTFGITSIGDLADRPLPWLVDLFGGAYGRYLQRASRGQDDSKLNAAPASRSISSEHTFAHDTVDRAEIWRMLQAQAREVTDRLREDGVVAGEVAIKVRYGVSFETITRQQRLVSPTADPAVLAAGAAALMRRAWTRRPIRLIGLRAARLEAPSPAEQLPLLPA